MTAPDSASQKANRIAVLLLLIAIGHIVPAIGLFLWCVIVVGWTAAVLTAGVEPTFATLIGERHDRRETWG